MKEKRLIFFVIFILTPAIIYANPIINSVSGNIDNGAGVTLAGTDFGIHQLNIEWLGGSDGNIEQGISGNIFSKTNDFSKIKKPGL